MKRASVLVISLVAVCAALVGACESDYDKLSDDLLESGWGEDAGTRLPTCMPPTMDASTGTDAGGGSQDAGMSDAGGDSGSNGDGAAPDAGGTPDSGTPDAGDSDGG